MNNALLKFWRRLNFQLHLWTGVLLAAYVSLMGVTGSILVFSDELRSISSSRLWHEMAITEPNADAAVVIGNLQRRYPHTHIVSLMTPTAREPVFIAVLQRQRRIVVACHPLTGAVLREMQRRSSWLDRIAELHENLFARRTGRILNGIGAGCLMLLGVTGLVNWWRGIRNWRAGIKVDLRRRWRRINFDLHRAIGFWSVIFLLLWASTGMYFAWPDHVSSFVGHLSSLVNSRPPIVSVDSNSEPAELDFQTLLQRANALDPGTKWKGMIFPASRRSPFEIFMSRGEGVGRDYEDTLYFNPYNGVYISTWKYGIKKTFGDWFIWLQVPMHFGTHWGLGIKVVWGMAGLALPVLAVTGLTMYWNRVLSKKWNLLRRAPLRSE